VVVIGQTMLGQLIAQQHPKTPLHPVADDCIADPLRHSDAVAPTAPAIGLSQQHKTGPRNAQAVIGSQKISALRDDR